MLGEQSGICIEKYPKNKFSVNEPILTNNSPSNSAQQAETLKNFKTFPDYILEEQLGIFYENIPP
jgi:hypothetical protein